MKRQFLVSFVLLTVLTMLAACVPAPTPAPQPVGQGIANPASENCVERCGVLEIRKEGKGEVGYCKFADDPECEEWALMREDQ